MKKLLFALITAAAACAPATVAPPQPVPATPPPATPPAELPTDVPPPVPEELLTAVPDRWWLLDHDRDGVFGAGVDRAYAEVLSNRQPRREVIVAIIDSGVDIEHEDLAGVIWRNPREQRNSRDDDGNGYVDDIAGWNFIGGRDGRHVDHDTYEVTRLFAACERAAGRLPEAPPRPEPVSPETCPAISAEFAAKRAEYEQMLVQIRSMNAVVQQIVSILRAQLGGDTLTVERVRALTPLRNDVRQAREYYLQLAQQRITPQMISDEAGRIEDLLEYSFNPSFDPRPIVGDDYANPNERTYGNNDVAGPDAAHGTGVAGIVAAQRGNDIGIDGIASGTRIMVIRTVPNGDERDKDVANAIRYAVDNGAHIVNMSFGKAFSPWKSTVDDAVRYAMERGVLLVHAAGNDGKDLAQEPNFPNRYLGARDTARLWIEVGASGWEGRTRLAADFSNYGARQVDVFAPGVEVLSTAPGNAYEAASGTSFAAPVVSGIAALLMAYYPDLSAADVRRIILESAVPVRDQMVERPGDPDTMIRFGDLSITGAIVNAYNAVRMAERLSEN